MAQRPGQLLWPVRWPFLRASGFALFSVRLKSSSYIVHTEVSMDETAGENEAVSIRTIYRFIGKPGY